MVPQPPPLPGSFPLAVIGNSAAARRAVAEAAQAGLRTLWVAPPEPRCDLAAAFRETALGVWDWPAVLPETGSERGDGPAAALWSQLDRLRDTAETQLLARCAAAGVVRVQARPRLVGPDRIELRDLRGAYRGEFRAGTILLAPSTRPLRPLRLGGRGRNVMTTSDLTSRAALPADVAVIGAGFTGLRTARLLAQLGCQVTLYEERSGAELTSERAWLDRSGAGSIELRDGTEILAAEEPAAGRVSLIALDGTRREHSAAVLAVGRYAFTAAWNLPQAGVGLDPRGRIWCDRQGRTWAAGVYACGEAIVEAGGGWDDAGQIEAALEAVRARVEESSGRRAAAAIG